MAYPIDGDISRAHSTRSSTRIKQSLYKIEAAVLLAAHAVMAPARGITIARINPIARAPAQTIARAIVAYARRESTAQMSQIAKRWLRLTSPHS